MKNNYEFCIKEVLKSEGRYTNDPADSGGETNFGITQRETSIPVRTMKVEQAKAIYKKKYWDAVDGDNLSNGVDYAVFDYGVNSGVGRSRKVLQQFKDLKGDKLIDAIMDEREAFLRNLAVRRPKDKKFLKGWMNRTARVRKQAHDLNKPSTTTGVGPVIAAGGGVAVYSYWDMFLNHWGLYTFGIAAVAIAVDVAIYFYRKNKNVRNY